MARQSRQLHRTTARSTKPPGIPSYLAQLRRAATGFAAPPATAERTPGTVSSHELDAEEVEEQVLYAEPFEVPRRTADAVTAARREGRPVIAVGTTVVRALESAWEGDRVRAASGFTRLLVHPGRPVRSVDELITGLHDPLASHLAMLYAIAPKEMVRAGYAEAVRERYLWHELGNSHLLLARAA